MEKEFERDMTPRLIGETYMKYPTEKSSRKYRYGLYECPYCGKEFEGSVDSVKRGHIKSCGCLKGDAHGLTSHRFYSTWANMIARCINSNNPKFYMYGARGITVCEEWLDVRNFVAWADITYIEGMTLDRIDNDGGYSPENCTWSDKTTQAINQRIMKNNKSEVVGVHYHVRNRAWTAYISINSTCKHIGSFKTKEEAVQARDNYITQNNLPHKLSTDYKREEA